jgi:O-antigen/teichoic acid export membrane protein
MGRSRFYDARVSRSRVAAAGPPHRAVRRSSRAVGAVAAQFSQAIGSFLVQLIAARTLGLDEFGVFALLIGAIVIATGLMTGFVGDSLTVLDRADPRIRSALQIWCLAIVLFTLVVGTVGAELAGVGSRSLALLFGLTMALWVLEDTARRLLMATMRFWSVVAVDLVHASTAIAWLWFAYARNGELTLADFLLALLIGQSVALVVGLACAPRDERRVASWRGAALSTVARFGVWRGLQQGIRPSTLTGARAFVAIAAGSAAVGQLEAARVYMAPALLFVQGIGSFLLAVYAADRDTSTAQALRKADRAVLALLGASLVMGIAATALVGRLGPLVSGADYDIDPLATAAWATFAASVAAGMPYASLAAVRGRQVRVVLLRLVDALLSVGAVAGVLWLLDVPPAAVPFAIAGGAFLGAVFQRALVVRTGDRNPAASARVV